MDAGTLQEITELVQKCRNERDIDRQLKILLVVNAMLPPTKKLHVPSYLTDDYINSFARDRKGITEQLLAPRPHY